MVKIWGRTGTLTTMYTRAHPLSSLIIVY